ASLTGHLHRLQPGRFRQGTRQSRLRLPTGMSAQLIVDLRGIWLHLPEFGAAVVVTLCLAAVATPASGALGVVLVLGKTSSSRAARALSTAYVELFRNVPGLIVIYFVFFLLPLVDLPLSPFVSAVVALAAQHAAYFCEIYRGALTAIGP